GLPTQLPDIDPEETNEWVASLDEMVNEKGRGRARYVMLRLLERAREQSVGVPPLRSTDYINTITPEREPWFRSEERRVGKATGVQTCALPIWACQPSFQTSTQKKPMSGSRLSTRWSTKRAVVEHAM